MDSGGTPDSNDPDARLAGPPVEQLTPSLQPRAIAVGFAVGTAVVVGVVLAVVLLA
jgi:hypothetical protein